MLLFGPALVAHDARRTAPVTPYGVTATRGRQVFLANCGSCHTLAAAGSTGQLGPNLFLSDGRTAT
jgi:mono/diheme cytochrome c family protein